ncbi:hypothetical protein [uncultured Brevundimonas sp.]|uniref:hypothetical protein n=1 Tax=uncultured Brevundimonas sp. TaxID=213418 RepID=UPI0030EBF937
MKARLASLAALSLIFAATTAPAATPMLADSCLQICWNTCTAIWGSNYSDELQECLTLCTELNCQA